MLESRKQLDKLTRGGGLMNKALVDFKKEGTVWISAVNLKFPFASKRPIKSWVSPGASVSEKAGSELSNGLVEKGLFTPVSSTFTGAGAS